MAKSTVKVTKKAQAEKIYTRMMNRKKTPTPAVIKAEFVTKVGMTVRQAATYYHMIDSGKWAQ